VLIASLCLQKLVHDIQELVLCIDMSFVCTCCRVLLRSAGGQLPAQPDADGGRGLTRNANLAGGQHDLAKSVMQCSTIVATVAMLITKPSI
jgi:hypothetical protein